MPVFLVRHAHAGRRSVWSGDDRERPLSGKGRRQVDGLCDVLDGVAVDVVGSSPYRRCVETVAPVASARHLDVTPVAALAEGASTAEALDWLLAHADRSVVACSHGDVIPNVVRRLLRDGLQADEGAVSQKGSIWVLEAEGGRFVRGRYLPPTTPDD